MPINVDLAYLCNEEWSPYETLKQERNLLCHFQNLQSRNLPNQNNETRNNYRNRFAVQNFSWIDDEKYMCIILWRYGYFFRRSAIIYDNAIK